MTRLRHLPKDEAPKMVVEFAAQPLNDKNNSSCPAKVLKSGKVKVFTFVGSITYESMDEFKKEWKVRK
jgi:hypothetical protein